MVWGKKLDTVERPENPGVKFSTKGGGEGENRAMYENENQKKEEFHWGGHCPCHVETRIIPAKCDNLKRARGG